MDTQRNTIAQFEDIQVITLDNPLTPTHCAKEFIDGLNSDRDVPKQPQFLDGGSRAWQQVVMGFLLMFSSWGLINAFGVFQAYYSLPPSLGTPSAISWVGSLQSCLLLLCGAFGGHAIDAGYSRIMTITGSVLIVLSLFSTSLSGSGNGKPSSTKEKASLVYWQILLSQGVCSGLGMGLVFLPSVGVPATYFVKRRALALGVVTTGATVGGIIYPIIFELLLGPVGFRWAARVIGLVGFVTLGVACILIKPRTDLPRKTQIPLVELVAFRELRYTALVLGMLCSFLGVYIPYYFIQARIETAGVDLHGLQPFYFVTFLNTGGIFGRLLPNYLADKSGPIFVHAICVLIGGVLIIAWPFALNLTSLAVFAIIYGFFSGAFISLPPASVASITPNLTHYGSRFGMAVTCNGFALLAGPPIAGALIGNGTGYVRAALVTGLVVIAGAVGLGTSGFLTPGTVQKFKCLLCIKGI